MYNNNAMYPNLFGIPNGSYIIMMGLGIISAFALVFLYLKKKKTPMIGIVDILICGIVAIAIGILGAMLVQDIYTYIDRGVWKWYTGLTFYGGLIFGVPAFFGMFFIFKKFDKCLDIKDVLIIAPACITIAHAFGRIGCLMAGCCYGAVTDEWYGLPCSGYDHLNHIPTQLYESIFLFILSGVLTFLAFRFDFKYTFPVYLIAYPIERFIIEFYRSDYRGGADIALTPSQVWCIVFVIIAIPLGVLFKYLVFKEKKVQTNE